MKVFLISLSALLLLPNFFNVTLEKEPVYNGVELYDPTLSRINSIQKLISYADSISQNKYKDNSLQYAIAVEDIIRNRFFHGFSSYSFKQNWIAVCTQYLCGHYVANPVNPEEILQYPYAGCSQQVIVLTEVMRRHKISYRSLGFREHYTTELSYNNSWYFFDPNLEPNMSEEDRDVKNWKHSADSLKKSYNLTAAHLDAGFGKSLNAEVGEINATQAPRAALFQTVTKYLSKLLWFFPLLIVIYPRKRKA